MLQLLWRGACLLGAAGVPVQTCTERSAAVWVAFMAGSWPDLKVPSPAWYLPAGN